MFKSLALFSLLAAASARKCTNITVPVSLTSENTEFGIETPLSKIDVTNFIINLARQGGEPYPLTIAKGVSHIIPENLSERGANLSRKRMSPAPTISQQHTANPTPVLAMNSRS